MNTLLNLRLTALASLVLSTIGIADVAQANSLFSQLEVDQNRYAIVASPYASGTLHQLLILKQISNARPCWSESGANPTTINPLLVEFDFTDVCGRSTDSNGYSVRVGDEDLNWRYSLRVARRGNDLHLLAVPNVDRAAPELLVARTRGLTQGFAKFYPEPGWRLTERSYQGSSVGHMYLTHDQSLASLNATTIAARSSATPTASNPVWQPSIVTNPAPVVTVNPAPIVTTPQPTVQPPRTQPTQQRRRSFWQRIWRR
jgi:N-acetylmuramoyl-L-alanine amidase